MTETPPNDTPDGPPDDPTDDYDPDDREPMGGAPYWQEDPWH